MRPHTVRCPRLALGDGAATRVGFFHIGDGRGTGASGWDKHVITTGYPPPTFPVVITQEKTGRPTQFASITEVGTTGRFLCSNATNSVVRQNQTHAAAHNICGLCVPRSRCPVVPLSLRPKRESKLQVFSCVLTGTIHVGRGRIYLTPSGAASLAFTRFCYYQYCMVNPRSFLVF